MNSIRTSSILIDTMRKLNHNQKYVRLFYSEMKNHLNINEKHKSSIKFNDGNELDRNSVSKPMQNSLIEWNLIRQHRKLCSIQ